MLKPVTLALPLPAPTVPLLLAVASPAEPPTLAMQASSSHNLVTLAALSVATLELLPAVPQTPGTQRPRVGQSRHLSDAGSNDGRHSRRL